MLIRKFITFLLILKSVPSFSQGNNNDTLQGSKLKDAIVEKKLDKPVNIVNKRYTRGLFSNMMQFIVALKCNKMKKDNTWPSTPHKSGFNGLNWRLRLL